MTVASKPKTKGSPNIDRLSGQTVPIQLRSRSAPLWLLQLCYFRHRSSAIMWLLVAAMLTVYGWTVYSQQRWNQAYQQLEQLQVHERQLVTTNEMLKNQMAKQAQEPDTGLVPPNPAAAIVLPAAPQRSVRAATSIMSKTKAVNQNQKTTSIPLGY